MQSDSCDALARALAQVVTDAVREALEGLPAPSSGDVLIDVPEASRRLGLGTTTTKKLIASGQLRSVVVGRRRLIPADALSDFENGLQKAERSG
jgi:excisionase family DNA binding protein